MIVSMTGFGDATAERDGTHYAVEIRSLNNRFFKPVIKLPDNVSGLEPELETMLREQLGRGSITYILKMRVDSAEAAYHINTQALQAYLEQLQADEGTRRHRARSTWRASLQLPGVCQEPRDETRRDRTARPGGPRADRHGHRQAATTCAARRPARCSTDLMKHAKVIATSLARDRQKRAPFVIDDYHKRLSQRVNQLLSKAELQVNEADLLKEVAVFAERADIAEEIQRLTSHLEAFEQACRDGRARRPQAGFHHAGDAPRGEHDRVSKANDAQIARHIVEIKGAIDRLKEQVQNVE